jgi:hypothetical protein
MFRWALIGLMVVGGGGLLLFAQDHAAVGEVPECAVPDASTPTAPDALRLHMPDGQLISHGLTVYLTTNLTASQKPRLRMFRKRSLRRSSP